MPFRNQARLHISEAGITYSTRTMAGATRRHRLTTRWHSDTSFSVDWTPVSRNWGQATFVEHFDNGLRGLQESSKHFWRHEGAAVQNMEDDRRSHQAGSSKSRPANPKWSPAGSRPTGASATDDCVAKSQMAALPPTSHGPVPVVYKVTVAEFNARDYGDEYLTFSEGDRIEDVGAPIDAESGTDGWAFGRVIRADGGHSEPGWYPEAFAQ